MDGMVAGRLNKQIAEGLGISMKNGRTAPCPRHGKAAGRFARRVGPHRGALRLRRRLSGLLLCGVRVFPDVKKREMPDLSKNKFGIIYSIHRLRFDAEAAQGRVTRT